MNKEKERKNKQYKLTSISESSSPFFPGSKKKKVSASGPVHLTICSACGKSLCPSCCKTHVSIPPLGYSKTLVCEPCATRFPQEWMPKATTSLRLHQNYKSTAVLEETKPLVQVESKSDSAEIKVVGSDHLDGSDSAPNKKGKKGKKGKKMIDPSLLGFSTKGSRIKNTEQHRDASLHFDEKYDEIDLLSEKYSKWELSHPEFLRRKK